MMFQHENLLNTWMMPWHLSVIDASSNIKDSGWFSELMEDYFRIIEFKIYKKSYVTYLIKRNWFQNME